MEFMAFLIIYAIVVVVSMALRHVAAKRAAAESSEAGPAQDARPTAAQRKPMPAVSAFKSRLSGSQRERDSGRIEPAFNINDDESLVVGVSASNLVNGGASSETEIEEDVLGDHH